MHTECFLQDPLKKVVVEGFLIYGMPNAFDAVILFLFPDKDVSISCKDAD